MTFARDPVSASFDTAAAALLRRAHARQGKWTGTTLRNPSAQWLIWGVRHGHNMLGPDDAPSGAARTAWARSFIRSVYWTWKHHYFAGEGVDLSRERTSPLPAGALRYRVGTVRITTEGIVRGRVVQVQISTGGQAAAAAAERLPAARRYILPEGELGPAWSDPERRWWER